MEWIRNRLEVKSDNGLPALGGSILRCLELRFHGCRAGSTPLLISFISPIVGSRAPSSFATHSDLILHESHSWTKVDILHSASDRLIRLFLQSQFDIFLPASLELRTLPAKSTKQCNHYDTEGLHFSTSVLPSAVCKSSFCSEIMRFL